MSTTYNGNFVQFFFQYLYTLLKQQQLLDGLTSLRWSCFHFFFWARGDVGVPGLSVGVCGKEYVCEASRRMGFVGRFYKVESHSTKDIYVCR